MKILLFGQDRQIVDRIRNNDRKVLGELFLKYEKMVLNFVITNGGNRDDAEDILQESIIILWQRINSGRFEVKSKIGTFIYSVAKNKWLAQLRRLNKNTAIDEEPEFMSGDDPISVVIDGERSAIVRSAMATLTEICQQILNLFYFEERAMDDIANILNLANVNVVKSKKYQCKKSLEEALKGTGVFDGL